MIEEGKFSDFYHKARKKVLDKKKKKEEKKPEKAMDAGARAKRKLARKVHAKYVSGSTENVPDDIREDKVLKTIAKELDNASKMHKGQANKIRTHLKDMKKGGDKKEHDCASKVKHEEYGIGNCIPEHHTILEDGTVSHYDVEFEEYIVENCPVEDLEILVTEMHSHSAKKKVSEGAVTKEVEDLQTAAETGKGKYVAKADAQPDVGGPDKEGDEDPRSMYTKWNLVKNRLRAMGLKMSHEPEGETIEEAERTLASRMDRKSKLYDKTVKKAMNFARDEGEASGHARFNMSRLGREKDKLAAKRREANESVSEGMATPESGTGKYYNEKKPTDMQLAKRKKMETVKSLTNQGKHKEASAMYKEDKYISGFRNKLKNIK